MKWKSICLVLICVIGLALSQKLFFKSNKLLQQEIDEAKKIKDDEVGFGFGAARQYLTEPDQETEQPKKHSAVKRKPEAHSFVRCDDNYECPSGHTCCWYDGLWKDWQCCPLTSAYCCSDHLHCCPLGHKCDYISSSCVLGSQTMPWLSKTPAVKLENVKCNSTLECPSKNTCCKLASDQWGCCPL